MARTPRIYQASPQPPRGRAIYRIALATVTQFAAPIVVHAPIPAPRARAAPRPIVLRSIYVRGARPSTAAAAAIVRAPRPVRATPRPIVLASRQPVQPMPMPRPFAPTRIVGANGRLRAPRPIVTSSLAVRQAKPVPVPLVIAIGAAWAPRRTPPRPVLVRARYHTKSTQVVYRPIVVRPPRPLRGAPLARVAATALVSRPSLRPPLFVAAIGRRAPPAAPRPIVSLPRRPAATPLPQIVVGPPGRPGRAPRPILIRARYHTKTTQIVFRPIVARAGRPPSRAVLVTLAATPSWGVRAIAVPRIVVAGVGKRRPTMAPIVVLARGTPRYQLGPPPCRIILPPAQRRRSPVPALAATRATPVVLMKGPPPTFIIRAGTWPRRAAWAQLLRTPFLGYGLPDNLFAAAVQWLRMSPAVLTAFGDGGIGFAPQKIWSDFAPPTFVDSGGITQKLLPPYLTFHELAEPWSFESPADDGTVNSFGIPAEFQVSIFATTKLQARRLGRLITARTIGLYDAPLTFADGTLLYLRPSNQYYGPAPESGLGAQSAEFHRIIEFTYVVQRTI